MRLKLFAMEIQTVKLKNLQVLNSFINLFKIYTFILGLGIGSVMDDQHSIDDMVNFGYYEPSLPKLLSHQLRLARDGGIIEECCYQPCTFATLQSYCMM